MIIVQDIDTCIREGEILRTQLTGTAHGTTHGTAQPTIIQKTSFWRRFFRQWDVQLMVVPALIFIFIFMYIPMYGILMSFQDYDIFQGFWNSPWVGFKHFEMFFTDPVFPTVMRNTIVISLLKLVIGFPAPI